MRDVFSFFAKIAKMGRFLTYRFSLKSKVKNVRSKERINVLFVLSDLALWKTEGLYRAMLKHPRFNPIIGTTLVTADNPSESIRKYESLMVYLKKNSYEYTEIYLGNIFSLKPDIVFYQEPYEGFISSDISYENVVNHNALVCDVHYSMRTLAVKKKNIWLVDQWLYRHCWQMYFENSLTAKFGSISWLKGKNIVVTGMPIQDELLKSEAFFANPWCHQEKKRKRIIFAPHHTIPTENRTIKLSCFLDVCDDMLELAEKYENDIQIAFKPHPFLKKKLINFWGQNRTNEYYEKWSRLNNGQLVEGAYLDLFKHSDAMIHDCDSFTLEYCFVKKPVMFLIEPTMIDERRNDLNEFGQGAFDVHYKGFTKNDIECFIKSVISGEDLLEKKRNAFYEQYLLPPNGKTASENIMNAILGEAEYSEKM